MSDTLIAGLRERLGTADDADEPTVLAALDEALAEQTDPPAAPPAAAPEGTVLVDAQALAQLQASAARGDEARAQQETERRDRLVTEAVRDGRIAPAQRDSWLAKLTAEGETGEQTLAALAKGLIPVTGPVGAEAANESTEDDAVYASLFGEKKGA